MDSRTHNILEVRYTQSRRTTEYVALFCAKAGCETVAMYVNNGIY